MNSSFLLKRLATNCIANVRKPTHNKYVACYFQSWAIYRNGDGVFQIQDIKPEHCTHLIYAFAGLNESTYEIKSRDKWADLKDHNGKDGYNELTKLKYRYEGLKVSLAIGGWNEDSRHYSEMAKNPKYRKRFVESVVHFLRAYNFDGLDFDWEFPNDRGGAEYDRYNFVELLKELRAAFLPHRLGLTAAISADLQKMEHRYDIRRMAEYLDHIHVMTYDYHVLEGRVIMPNAPLDKVNDTLTYLTSLGVRPNKFILGLPTYGRGYILVNPLRSHAENPMGKRSQEASWSGPYNNKPGFFGYNEICKAILPDAKWTQKWDNLSSTPYAMLDMKVLVYDDIRSIRSKVEVAMKLGLGGVMIWSIDTDDFRGDCAPQEIRNQPEGPIKNYQYPLVQAITSALERDTNVGTTSRPIHAFVLLVFSFLVTVIRQ
ncbi:hypothetical protein QAD02_015727 [Eretmocerus hayati]|uniref:Uncharacterized protein n=1 Tax=Eretmocerus hayati TaxID=131215 RepID=A0ACC2P948_9HYME|nr:hypothetical protein QAD02_015727 [Eretmocerus hayati]